MTVGLIVVIVVCCIICLPLIFFAGFILVSGLLAWWAIMIDLIKGMFGIESDMDKFDFSYYDY